MRRLMLAAVLGLWAVAAGRAEADLLLGNDFSGVLYDVNTSTGAATNPRGGGINGLTGIAFRSDGTLFGLTTFGASPADSLLTIDPTTGASTLVGPIGLGNIIEGDITFNPTNGILYGLYTGSPDNGLFTINTTTGAGTLIGPLSSLDDPSGMAFNTAGNLLVLDTGINSLLPLLATVDPSTGTVLSTVPLSQPIGALAGMAIDSSGTVFVADGGSTGTQNLYTLNETTGVLTLVGPTGLANGLAGLTFAATASVPEPSSLTVVAISGLAVSGYWWHKRRRAAA